MNLPINVEDTFFCSVFFIGVLLHHYFPKEITSAAINRRVLDKFFRRSWLILSSERRGNEDSSYFLLPHKNLPFSESI